MRVVAHKPIRPMFSFKPPHSMEVFNFGQGSTVLASSFHTQRSALWQAAATTNATPTKDDATEEQPAESEVLDPKDEKIKELETKSSQLRTELQYALAEQQNIRARLKKDVDNAKMFGIQGFAKDLLGVSDNLERCLASVTPAELDSSATSLKSLHEAITMTEKELTKTFKRYGLEKFDPLGQKFDPNTMNAVTQFPDPVRRCDRALTYCFGQTKEPHTVAIVMKPGYILHERVIRPADVAVVKPPENSA